MIGSMTATLVTFNLTIKTKTVDVQKILNNAFPGILVLIIFFSVYWAMKKKKISAPVMIVVIIGFCILASALGIA